MFGVLVVKVACSMGITAYKPVSANLNVAESSCGSAADALYYLGLLDGRLLQRNEFLVPLQKFEMSSAVEVRCRFLVSLQSMS